MILNNLSCSLLSRRSKSTISAGSLFHKTIDICKSQQKHIRGGNFGECFFWDAQNMKALTLQQGHTVFVEHRETQVITTIFQGAPIEVTILKC